MIEKLKFVLERVENFVGNGENAGKTSIFSFSYNVFKMFLFHGCQKLGLFCKELYPFSKSMAHI